MPLERLQELSEAEIDVLMEAVKAHEYRDRLERLQDFSFLIQSQGALDTFNSKQNQLLKSYNKHMRFSADEIHASEIEAFRVKKQRIREARKNGE